MLGISRGSLEELLVEYKDFARLRSIDVWNKNDPRLREIGERVKRVKRETGKCLLPSLPSQSSTPLYLFNRLNN